MTINHIAHGMFGYASLEMATCMGRKDGDTLIIYINDYLHPE
jgi:hypothetical protein